MKGKIVKRDGRKEEFNIEKLRAQINPACEGTDISPIEFESKLSIDFSNKITSKDIQEQLVMIAKNSVTDIAPDWDVVAGRLLSHQVRREVWKNTKIDLEDYKDHFHYLHRNGYYRSDVTSMVDDKELDKLSKYIKPRRDYDLRLSQIALLSSKYLISNQKGLIEYPSTADMTNSIILASTEPEHIRTDIAKEYYDMLSNYYISLATPFKANLRIPNGNTGSCFVGENGDSLTQIMKAYTDMSSISKEGGGIGWDWSNVRPSDTYSEGVPKANNINKWIKIVNDIAVAVNQRGKRAGAITPSLSWWHLDIESFLEMKSELNGDLRDKCFDLFPQIVVDSYFMDALDEGRDVYLFNQYEYNKLTGKVFTELIDKELYEAHKEVEELIEKGKLKHYKKISSKALWKKSLEVWIETGDFYICSKDNINMSNYLKKFAIAKGGNLCQESFSLSTPATSWKKEVVDANETVTDTDGLTHSCSLISINVATILNDDKLLQKACKASVRMLDSSIDLGTMPVLEAKTSSELLRNIGIGVVGMADYMAWNKVHYDTEEGMLLAEKLVEKIAYYCYNASIDLAIEKGSYPLYEKADYSTLFGRDPIELTKESPNGFDWTDVQARIRHEGIRNFLINAFAPNTSSGLVQGVTASYLPAHSKNNTQKLAGLIVPVLPRYIKQRPWGYKTKFQYKATDIIKFTQRLQKWVDTGMSMEVPINVANCTIGEISKEIRKGFREKKLKTVYYSLTIDNEAACEGCAN